MKTVRGLGTLSPKRDISIKSLLSGLRELFGEGGKSVSARGAGGIKAFQI